MFLPTCTNVKFKPKVSLKGCLSGKGRDLTFSLKFVSKYQLRVPFFGKNPIPDSESKNGFFYFFGKIQKGIMNPMNPCLMKIQWINPNPNS